MKVTISRVFLSIMMMILFLIPISNSESYTSNDENPQNSALAYNLTGSILKVNDSVYDPFETAANILIDELNPSYTWENLKSENEWCSGSGTLEDPYIIQYVFIDGEMYGSTSPYYAPILIRNSEKYFIIQGCTVIRAGDSGHNGGIRLESVTNGIITQNNLSYNNAGILLRWNSYENIIERNVFTSDFNYTYGGMYYNSTYGSAWAVNVQDCNNNIIRYNKVYNYCEGIRIHESTHHIIDSNTIIIDKYDSIGDGGIILTRCNYTTVINNTLVGVGGEFGVGEIDSVGNIIEENSFFGYDINIQTASSVSTSITLDFSNYNIIRKNLIFASYYDYLIYLRDASNFILIVTISIISSSLLLLAVALYYVYRKRTHS